MKSSDLTVLIIGAGAREHVISRAYEKSSIVSKIIISPGNDFMKINRDKTIIIDPNSNLNDAESFLRIANKYQPDLIDVAQDNALAVGTVDLLQQNGYMVFGPTKAASRIEWDKAWSRNFMKKYGIKTPHYDVFDTEEDGIEFINSLYQKNQNSVVYIKASGLCAGKGALKSESLEQAKVNIRSMKEFGEAGKTYLIEEGISGEEFSIYAITDGHTFYVCKPSQDNKLSHNFDEGFQTGGMGAIAPTSIIDGFIEDISNNFIKPVIEGMKQENHPYIGIIYFGGIVTNNKILTIEYNARWGDPECQVVLPGIQTSYAEIVLACLNGKLDELKIEEDNFVRVCVVGTSKGYPNDYSQVKGKQIFGLNDKRNDIELYSAGIQILNNKFVANGGRLFSIVGKDYSLIKAKQAAYNAISGLAIEGNNLHYRTDIGWRDIERENTK
ncbi:MAG: phosphoribosylamine--glycine ligase [Candidatus Heimdallarchaeota archaeon]|nr:phosphoribosylamine--glycine ligase [Candidatus Heimdallarchaeota archaeon]MDH5647064.1 phosphoribosylamine--glycine ligase [Candidatus Heimdallarchaeota archaeon]